MHLNIKIPVAPARQTGRWTRRTDRQTDCLSLCCKKSRQRFIFQCLLAAEVSRRPDKTLLCSVVLFEKGVKTEGQPWHLSRYSHLRAAAAAALLLSTSKSHAGSGRSRSQLFSVKGRQKTLSRRETFSFVPLWTGRWAWPCLGIHPLQPPPVC